MTSRKRVAKVFSALVMILCSAGMFIRPDFGYVFVVLFLDITLLLYGLRLLIYYFTMARFMVGGISVFYKSIIILDLGLFVFGLDSIPQKYVMVYLIICLAFSGLVDVLRSNESRRLSAPWRLHFSYGVGKVAIAVVCLFMLDSLKIMTWLYCIGLLHSAALNLINAFRKTAIVYIG